MTCTAAMNGAANVTYKHADQRDGAVEGITLRHHRNRATNCHAGKQNEKKCDHCLCLCVLRASVVNLVSSKAHQGGTESTEEITLPNLPMSSKTYSRNPTRPTTEALRSGRSKGTRLVSAIAAIR